MFDALNQLELPILDAIQSIRCGFLDGVVKEVSTRLGVVIANAINLLNPELIVLNGFMLQLGDYFLNQLETAIRENVLSVAGDFEIRISESLATILPLGAVAEICNSYLRSDDFKWIYQLQRNGDEQ